MKLLLILLLAITSLVAKEDALTSNNIIVLYNADDEESKTLANFYADQRGIAKLQVWGISMPVKGKITRAEFDLIRVLYINKLKESLNPKLSTVVCMRGVPFGINRDGKQQNEASFDSELSVLTPTDKTPKAINNPYFKKNIKINTFRNLHAHNRGLRLVTRIDGPSLEICKRIITDAIATEKRGLWGMTYLDKAHKGGSYKMGDASLIEIEKLNWSLGLPTVLEDTKTTYPINYPMEHAAVYFGWYTGNVNGPFKNPNFKFRQGAVAAHLHSFSGSNIRNAKGAWVGPLLDKGACAVLGNVYEPYLQGTTQFEIFYQRLTEGYTFAEASYMATPLLSWQTVMIGDPLYRPFKHVQKVSGEQHADDKIYRVMRLVWELQKDTPADKLRKLRSAAAKLESSELYEFIGLWKQFEGDDAMAEKFYNSVVLMKAKTPQALRCQLHLVDLLVEHKQQAKAVKMLQSMLIMYADSPHFAAIKSLHLKYNPPPPSVPGATSPK